MSTHLIILARWLHHCPKSTEATPHAPKRDAYRGFLGDEGFRESRNFLGDDEAQGG